MSTNGKIPVATTKESIFSIDSQFTYKINFALQLFNSLNAKRMHDLSHFIIVQQIK